MKKMMLMAAVVLLALPALAQTQDPFPSFVQVNGFAEKEIAPDEFYLSITINERDSKGKISVETQQREMIATLKKLGVNTEKQLKVANLSSEFFKKNSSVASADYQLKLTSAAEVAKVWQALDGLGISNVSVSKVANTKIEQYKQQVRAEAIQNAKKCATELATAIGQSIGKCFNIFDYSNNNNDYMPAMYNSMKVRGVGSASEAATDEPLEFKNIKLQYNVQAKFVLE